MTPKRVIKPVPLKGLYKSAPADLIGQEYSPNSLNVRFRFGEIRPTPGRGLFDAAPLNEPAQILGQFGLSVGIKWLFYLTQTKLFRRGVVNPFDSNQWTEILGALVPAGTDVWSWTSGEDHLFFCRGSDELLQWDGNPANPFDLVENVVGFQPVDGSAGVSPAPRFLEYFADRVICANVVEGGVTFANRLRWPERGDFRHWDGTLGLGAGFLDLNMEYSEPINGMKALGDRLAVYSLSSIAEVVETGQIDPTFVYHVRVRGIGCAAPHTIGKANTIHFFLGKDMNVWSWDGIQPRAVGDPIWKELQVLTHEDALGTYFGFVVHSRREYWLVLADPTRGTYETFVLDYSAGSWSRDTFPSLTAAGEVEVVENALTWNDLVGTWDEQTLTWEQFGGTSMSTIVGGRNDGSTMVIDEKYSYDYFTLGSIMECFVETEDHYCQDEGAWIQEGVLRVMILYDPISAGDSTFFVAISFDHGRSWEEKEISPSRLGYSFADFIRTGHIVRYRFREKDNNVQFRWRNYGYEYIASGQTLPGPPP